MTRIAVVADVHLHDLYGGYGTVERGAGDMSLRTLSDTMASTRVFNESHPAFLAVLEDIVRRGLRDVVLLGDYLDDGQIGAVNALKAILTQWQRRHGLRFFAIFGNHDCYGPASRHLSKPLTDASGGRAKIVGSDAGMSDEPGTFAAMRGMSTLEALAAMAEHGIGTPDDLVHWETPFGRSADPKDRKPASDVSGLDASYLVEPQSGLWLLLLDANVFERVQDGWQVKADAAWDHVLTERPYLLRWIEDVCQRAAMQGKTLLAFSHYPAVPLCLSHAREAGETVCTPDWRKRMPSLATSRRLAQAGIKLHFSGHMHVVGRTQLDDLVNIAVPSPVAYPGGYVVVSAAGADVNIETVQLRDVPNFDVAFAAYRAQTPKPGGNCKDAALAAVDYPHFLRAHLLGLVRTKQLAEDWPAELSTLQDVSLNRVFVDIPAIANELAQWPCVGNLHFLCMIEDYYLLRAGGDIALAVMSPDKLSFYRNLASTLTEGTRVVPTVDLGIVTFLDLFVALLQRNGDACS